MTNRLKKRQRSAPGSDVGGAVYAWLVSRRAIAQEEMNRSAAGTSRLARHLRAREVCEDLLDFLDGELHVVK